MSFHTANESRVQSSLISLPRARTAGVDEVLRIDPKLRQNDVQDKEKQKKSKKKEKKEKKMAPPLTELIPLELWRIGDVCYILI